MINCTSRFLLCAGLLLGSATAWAGTVTGVTSPADLGANDSIDWGQLGPAGTELPTPQNWTSALGVTGEVGVVNPSDLLRLDEGNGWGGNFAPGDHLIWNIGAGTPDGSIGILAGSNLFSALGANIQADFYGPFTATITAYDSSFNVLGSFSEDGVSNGNNDGSAIFIGLKDTAAEIQFVTFRVLDINGGNDLAINTALINTGGSNAVPEPGSVAMLVGMGLSGAGFLARRRRK